MTDSRPDSSQPAETIREHLRIRIDRLSAESDRLSGAYQSPPGFNSLAIPVLTGPTACGKTALSMDLARQARAGGVAVEIVNADSLIVYRELDIGSAKPTAAERAEVPHHLVDVLDLSEQYTAAEYRRAVMHAIREIRGRGAVPLVVGGSGFYLKVLFRGVWEAPPAVPALRAMLDAVPLGTLFERLNSADPAWAAKVGSGDRYRLVRALEILETTGKTPSELEAALRAQENDGPRLELHVLDLPNEILFDRVSSRTQAMLKQGLVDETRTLVSKYGQVRPLRSVGYGQVIEYLEGRAPSGRKLRPGLDGLADEIDLATRQLIKQQRTWFKSLSEK